MKKLLVIIGILLSSITYAQTQWKIFINSFPKIDIPFALDTRIVKKIILISRNDAWNYIIEPATRINTLKGYDLSQSFPIDSTIAHDYNQWNNFDLNKRDTLEFFSPTVGYRIAGLARFTINKDFQGIIWYLYPEREVNLSFGSKACFWLFIYDNTGNVADIAELNGEEGNYAMCLECSSHSISKVYYSSNQIKIKISKVFIAPIDNEENDLKAKTKKKYSEITYTISDNGLIN